MTPQELQDLKGKMPKGYRQKIREKTGFSFAMIDYVFTGQRNNQAIIVAAIDILEEHNRQQEVFQARLKKALETANPQLP